MKLSHLAMACGMALIFLTSAFANHNTPEALEARVSAVGTLNVSAGDSGTATTEADGPADGESVYQANCAACHTAGIAGAPALGDAAGWEERLTQGLEILAEHAIQGYTGSAGVMPAKGGNPALSDEAVTAAVQYMVDQVQ